MVETVVIPTVGTGSRLGEITRSFNKALLPYKNKPIISHIIDHFPDDTKFVIPVGFMGSQVRDFLESAYPDRWFKFVDVSWEDPNAGTSMTLLACKRLCKGPFWYIACDTYFDEPNIVQSSIVDEDVYFCKPCDEDQSSKFTMMRVENGRAQEIVFKQPRTNWHAFIGMMRIVNFEPFFEALEETNSKEHASSLKTGTKCLTVSSWIDMGDPVVYTQARKQTQAYDFTKPSEITWFCNYNARVVKWWDDASVADKKQQRADHNPNILPPNVSKRGNFISYDMVPGTTLYRANDPTLFNPLLRWLETDVWVPVHKDISESCAAFYKTKTEDRIAAFLARVGGTPNVKTVDGVAVRPWREYFSSVNWSMLSYNYRSAWIHGDLHFDNLIVTPERQFKVIDWRHEFGKEVIGGDKYYDLAKMMGGFVIDYTRIKQNDFSIDGADGHYTLNVPAAENSAYYKETLLRYVDSIGMDRKKVQTLVPLIFWNMAPLHTPPFDMFLWCLGLKLFGEMFDD